MCLSLPSSGDLVGQRALSALWEHVEKDRLLCIVMSPTDSRLLDLVVEIATAQPQNGRHFVCITLTNSSLNHTRSLKALRSIRGVHTVVADGCAFLCRCVMAEHVVAAGWQFVTALPQLARKMQRRCTGGHVLVQRSLDRQMPVRMRQNIVTRIRQTRDRPETAQSVAAVDDTSGEEESGDILGCLRRLHVNLGHPKNNVLLRHLRHAHATQRTLEAARNCECPACEAARHPLCGTTIFPVEVQLPPCCIAMDVKELPGWENGCNLCQWSVKEALCTLVSLFWRR